MNAWISRVEGQIAIHGKRNFPERSQVIAYFEKARAALKVIRESRRLAQMPIRTSNLTPMANSFLFSRSRRAALVTSALVAMTVTAIAASPGNTGTEPLAFPGAEGYGRVATGGRGHPVYKVTNLNDAGPGSLRDAVGRGNRTVIFTVAGTIALESPLVISHPSLTLAGQTAPGDGICIRNYEVFIAAENVIVRFLRFRVGDQKPQGEEGQDALGARGTRRIIVDHCSLSWGTDETASFYDNQDTTMQWCLISESLNRSIHTSGAHGMGGLWGGQRASFHHNLLAHHRSRNPRIVGSQNTARPDLEHADVRNNVVYNWSGSSGYGGEGGVYNIVDNYYKPGPATPPNLRGRIFAPNPEGGAYKQRAGVWGTFFLRGNIVNGNEAVTRDNWAGVHPQPPTKPKADLLAHAEHGVSHVTTTSASEAYQAVLAYVGASISRDGVDTRIVREVRDGVFTHTGSKGSSGGIIDSQADVGGWPLLSPGNVPGTYDDRDNDGLPDAWEARHALGPAVDPSGDAGEGYTHLEDYLNQRAFLWENNQIGGTSALGHVTRDWLAGHYRLRSGGAGISGKQDSFHGYLQPLFGEGSLTARLNALNRETGAHAGIMLRSRGDEASAASVFIGVTSKGHILLAFRQAAGQVAATTTGAAVKLPCWLRLERLTGDTVQAHYALRPGDWRQVGSPIHVPLGAACTAGLAAAAPGGTALSEFDNVVLRMRPPRQP